MKRLWIVILSLSALSCNRYDNEITKLLDETQNVISTDCNKADSLLKVVGVDIDKSSESTQQKYRLLHTDLCNKVGRQLPTDSAFFPVVEYYDREGTPNEQVKAHYLLGCVYRDMNEMPVALQCYYDAIDKADTLSSDCDNVTLMCVWGQIALVNNVQNVPIQEIEAWKNYIDYAKKCGNTYEEIHGYESMISPYCELNDSNKVVELTDYTIGRYKAIGQDSLASQVYGSVLTYYLGLKDYPTARKYMDLFENESDLYDENHEITYNRESYYYYQGIYYQGINKLDSSEYYYKKLFASGRDFLASKGLFSLFIQKGVADSIVKYAAIYDRKLSEEIEGRNVDAICQAKSMYDFTRFQRLAERKQYEAELYFYIGVIIVIIFGIISVIVYRLVRNNIRKRAKQLDDLNDEYEKTRENYEIATDKLDEAVHMHEDYKRAKEEELGMVKDKVDQLQSKIDEEQQANDMSTFLSTKIVTKFLSMYDEPSADDWDMLINTLKDYVPHFYNLLFSNSSLQTKEINAAILVRLNMPAKQLAALLNINSVQQVTNMKARLNIKLFNKDGASGLYENLCNVS